MEYHKNVLDMFELKSHNNLMLLTVLTTSYIKLRALISPKLKANLYLLRQRDEGDDLIVGKHDRLEDDDDDGEDDDGGHRHHDGEVVQEGLTSLHPLDLGLGLHAFPLLLLLIQLLLGLAGDKFLDQIK